MKAISTIIATLLLLIITIALAGVAFTYISGVITGRTSVVLSIEASNQQCVGPNIIAAVTNDGTSAVSNVVVTARNSAGASVGSCTIASAAGGSQISQCTIARTAPTSAGTYALQAVSGSSIANGNVYCSS